MGMFDWFRRTRSPSVTQQRVDVAALRLELKELQDQFPELVTADFTTLVNRNAQGLGDFSDETTEMRALYRKYLQCEPTVKSALVGKVAAVVANRLSASPQNDEDVNERAEADFINAAFNSVDGGISIAVTHWLIAGLTDGWSISEKVWAIGEQGLLKGRWYVKGLKSKDTDNLRPLTDTYRNLVGIESTKDGGQVFDPSAFLRFAYLPLFESPTGTSDLRAAVSYVQFKHQAIKLRMIYLDKFKGPFIHGEWADKNDKSLLATALEKARASGVIVTRTGTKINILDLATGGTSDFKAAIEDLDKQIVVSVHGAFLHMLEGNNKDARGSSGVQERTTKGFQWLLAEYALNAIRRDLVADMIRFNFGADRPTPMVDFEAINPEEVLKNLQIDQLLQTMGAELSKKQVYRNSGRTPPVDDADRLVPPAPPMMPGKLPTAPGGGGNVPFDPAAKFAEKVKNIPVADIRIDPERFQFRRNKDNESGTVKSRKIEAIDPATVKPLLLWKDPADGFTYLIDGHHRVEAAKVQGIAELPAEHIQAADAEEAKRIGKEANRVQDAAKFAEPKPLPVVKPAASGEIALAGKDGRAAAGLMRNCIDEGKTALELVTRAVIERSMGNGVPTPFTAEERKLVQDTLASTLATSELLGRSRVRERATKAAAAGGLFKLSEEIPFSTFAEIPRLGGFEPLPPIQAANYFNNLIPTLNVDPRELAAAVDRQAFTLSAATEDVILRRVQDSLGSNLIGGGRSGGFQAVQSILDSAGVSPANPQYSELVYRTNMMDAYNVGQQREMQASDMQDMFPVWQYLGIDDGRQGSDHAPKFNRYYPSSASFAEVRGDRPFNCVLPGASVHGRFAGGFKSFYRGEAVEIETKNGSRLSLTVNHPVLTDAGFVAAGLLKKGQRLANYVGEREADVFGVDNQHPPALIEEVFKTLSVSLPAGDGIESIMPAAFDFHGDELSIEGNVDVVNPRVLPMHNLDASRLQGSPQPSLSGPNVLLAKEPSESALGLDGFAVRHSAPGSLSGGDLCEALRPAGDTRPFQLLRFGGGSRLDANRSQSANDGGTPDAELFGQLIDRFPALVAGDEIVHINRLHYAGHVYDLATDVGYFIAEGIIISNCRCTANPIDKYTWEEDLKPAGAILETSW